MAGAPKTVEFRRAILSRTPGRDGDVSPIFCGLPSRLAGDGAVVAYGDRPAMPIRRTKRLRADLRAVAVSMRSTNVAAFADYRRAERGASGSPLAADFDVALRG